MPRATIDPACCRRASYPTALIRDGAGMKSRAEVLCRVRGGHFLIRDLERTRWIEISDVIALDSPRAVA